VSYPPRDEGLLPASYPLENFEPFGTAFALPPRLRKFQSRVWLHALLFALTLASTTWVGAHNYAAFLEGFAYQPRPLDWPMFLHGLWYSGTLLAILGAHEMGHYLYCRLYNVDATLPYFLPMPVLLTGTLGAVIKIREAFPTRAVLFDIGVAGPLAGFAILVPALFWGMSMSNVVPAPTEGTVIFMGEPLLFQWAARFFFGTLPATMTVNMHPMVFAAWFGMLATAWNLLPFGQLDGGHIAYATLGRWSTSISIATVATAVVMTFFSLSWLVMTIMMLVMLFLLGPRHPRVLHEYKPLGPGRRLIAVIALIVFVLCFTPTPIELQDLVAGP